MSEQNPNSSQAPLPLPKGKRVMVTVAGVLLMTYVAMSALSLGTLQPTILSHMNAMEYYSLVAISASVGLAIMNPIGTKLGDLFGRRNIVVLFGLLAIASNVALALTQRIGTFLLFRFLGSAAQGAFTAAPYILAGEINPRKDVPKAMGYLAMALSVGTLVGSVISGALSDAGHLTLAIVYPALFLAVGIALIWVAVPNTRRKGVKVDWAGMAAMTLTLGILLVTLNFTSSLGWTNPVILLGFALSVAFGALLVKVEGRANSPIIPMRLFRNRPYVYTLLLGAILYLYNNVYIYYGPAFLTQVMGKSDTQAGMLQMARTVLVILLPALFGGWVAKKRSNNWKAMAVATAVVALTFVPFLFVNSGTSLGLMIALVAGTGISESLRAVSTTPSAQSFLPPEDLPMGTALCTFFNTLGSTLSVGIFAAVYNRQVAKAASSVVGIQEGFHMLALTVILIEAIGFVIALAVMPKYFKENPAQNTEEL